MLALDYLNQLRALLDRIETTQLEKIDQAAEMIADSLANGGSFLIHDSGHMLNSELIHRAGGLMALRAFTFGLSINAAVPAATARKVEPLDQRDDYFDLVIDASPLKAGDVLIIGSVSGRNPAQVGLALAARRRGIKLIAITSLSYSQSVTSRHHSGQRLFEVVDIAIDNCGVLGDACVAVEGLPVKALPTSGIGAATVAWLICAQVIEKLLARGIRPHVYKSVNTDDGADFNARETEDFEKTGI